MLRFHLDEHVNHAIARGLRSRGIDVTTTVDAGLLGASDDAHVAFALRESRVIVTHDPDFLALATQQQHAGIAWCQASSRTIGEIIRHLSLMNDCLEPAELLGKVEFL